MSLKSFTVLLEALHCPGPQNCRPNPAKPALLEFGSVTKTSVYVASSRPFYSFTHTCTECSITFAVLMVESEPLLQTEF